jgi:hypothetical protein
MSLKDFDTRLVLIFSIGQATGIPDVCFPVFATANNISSVITEAGVNLTAGIFVTPEFHFK